MTPAEMRDAMLEKLMHSTLDKHLAEPDELALKMLPPGRWSHLYQLYCAKCLSAAQPCASRSVFYEVAKKWRRCLQFRQRSQHSTCLVCDRLRAKMRNTRDLGIHLRFVEEYLDHLKMQWECRQAYWNARERSRMKDGRTLCLIVDGFDKSKPVVPRWPHGRQPKGGVFERVRRLGLGISCVLVHGYSCHIFVSDEAVPDDSSWTLECCARAIDSAYTDIVQRPDCN